MSRPPQSEAYRDRKRQELKQLLASAYTLWFHQPQKFLSYGSCQEHKEPWQKALPLPSNANHTLTNIQITIRYTNESKILNTATHIQNTAILPVLTIRDNPRNYNKPIVFEDSVVYGIVNAEIYFEGIAQATVLTIPQLKTLARVLDMNPTTLRRQLERNDMPWRNCIRELIGDLGLCS